MVTFRLLITGSRKWPEPAFVQLVLNHVYCLVVGGGPMNLTHGVCPASPDEYGDDWAKSMKRMGFPITIDPKPADWKKYGRAAGHRRNAEMVKLGHDLCIAFIHNNSSGASRTADLAEKAGIETWRYFSTS